MLDTFVACMFRVKVGIFQAIIAFSPFVSGGKSLMKGIWNHGFGYV